RHRVALRQHHERAGERDPNEPVDEAERIGPRDRDGGDREADPAQRQDLDNHLARVARPERGQRSRRDRGAALPRDEPSPAGVADRPVEPVPALLTGLARVEELVDRRARVGEILEQHQTALGSRGAVPAHEGTGTFFTTSSTIPRAVTPEKRACGSITSRCARTGTASSWTCSGTTKAPPSRSASAWAAFTSASEARGLAPSCTPGTVRVSRTRSTA